MSNRLIILCFFISISMLSQEVLWDKSYGGIHSEYLFDAIPTADFGFILAGSSLSDATGNKEEENYNGLDYCIWKVDSKGNMVWQKTYGTNGNDFLKSINHTKDGGFILGGHSMPIKKESLSENNFGYEDLWIIKLNAKGDIEWEQTIGGSQKDIISSIKPTADGGFIVAASSSSPEAREEEEFGLKHSPNYGNLDYWLIKLNAEGTIEWEQTYGGSYSDVLYEVWETRSGDYILGGTSNSPESGNKTVEGYGENDIWLLGVDREGNVLWQKAVGGEQDDVFGAMQLVYYEDTAFLFVGGSSNSPFSGNKSIDNKKDTDFWLLKLSLDGKVEWQEVYTIGGQDMLTSMAWAEDKETLYLAGHAVKNVFAMQKNTDAEDVYGYTVLEVDLEGKEQWRKTLGSSGTDRLQKLLLSRDNNMLLTGTSDGSVSKKKTSLQGREDFWVVMLGDKDRSNLDLESELEAYPNPTNGYSNIVVLHEFDKGMLSVYDIMGKRLQHFPITEATIPVDLSGYATGVYLIEVQTDVSRETLKILKK